MSLIAAPAGAALGPRVLAGSQATSAQWPFIAALVQHGRSAFDGQFCGGSVIAPTVVLTAAHCVTGSSAGSIDVVTGRAQLSASQLGQRLAVRSITVDPSYNANTEHHDAAVLRLASPTRAPAVSFAGSADPALLTPGSPLSVAGWGLLDNNGDAPDLLHAATIQALRIGSCQDAYGSDVSASLMICAGTPVTGTPDACQGDSGGPLVSGAGGAARLVGLVAFGGERCGDPSAPGVYTRVSAELPWIARVLGAHPAHAARAHADGPHPHQPDHLRRGDLHRPGQCHRRRWRRRPDHCPRLPQWRGDGRARVERRADGIARMARPDRSAHRFASHHRARVHQGGGGVRSPGQRRRQRHRWVIPIPPA